MSGAKAQARSEETPGNSSSSGRREKPWLLPYNRKLRHLQGLTIRNLTLPHAANPGSSSPGSVRSRNSKPHDDEALPSTLQSPGKLKARARRETQTLGHSHSSSELRAVAEQDRLLPGGQESGIGKGDGNGSNNGSGVGSGIDIVEDAGLSPKRPTAGRLRRRSTMEWSGASPAERQKRLEDVTAGRMADTFFSLHVPDREEPIYVSEVVEKAMNPNFRFFDLNSYGPAITRQDELTVKVWAKTEHMAKYQYLVELNLSLVSLQFIGRSLETFRQPLPENCILFHISDGVYTSFTDIPPDLSPTPFPSHPPTTDPDRILPTSSYDALMRLSTLDDCIQDALATREKLAADISALLAANSDSQSVIRHVAEARQSLAATKSAAATQRRRLEAATRRRDELKSLIANRRALIASGRAAQRSEAQNLEAARETLAQRRAEAERLSADIAGQRRRVCEDASNIFKIEPIPNRPLLFTIAGLPLPNSSFDDADDDVVAAALGHVAQLVGLLSTYLTTPLPYPVHARGSTSSIRDAVAMTTGPRAYPLFTRGVARFRFEYGVFLLNKDVEILASALGARILDIRHTLANLKYVIYVATAGEGELPARKAGGVRGLLRKDAAPSASGSGRTSNADGRATGADGVSLLSTQSKTVSKAKENGNLYKDANGQAARPGPGKRPGKGLGAYETLQEAASLQMG